MIVLSLLMVQLSPGAMVNAIMPIDSMVIVRTSISKLVNAMKKRDKMAPLHLRADLFFLFVVEQSLFRTHARNWFFLIC